MTLVALVKIKLENTGDKTSRNGVGTVLFWTWGDGFDPCQGQPGTLWENKNRRGTITGQLWSLVQMATGGNSGRSRCSVCTRSWDWQTSGSSLPISPGLVNSNLRAPLPNAASPSRVGGEGLSWRVVLWGGGMTVFSGARFLSIRFIYPHASSSLGLRQWSRASSICLAERVADIPEKNTLQDKKEKKARLLMGIPFTKEKKKKSTRWQILKQK